MQLRKGTSWGPMSGRADRVAPGPLDVADHRQRASLGVRQQPLRQARDEPLSAIGTGPWLWVGQVVVKRRGPGTIACEHEDNQTVKPSVVVTSAARGNHSGESSRTRTNPDRGALPVPCRWF